MIFPGLAPGARPWYNKIFPLKASDPMDYILRAVRDYLKKSDILLLLIALVASGIGMVLINSATWNMAGRTKLLLVQLLAIGLGAVCYLIASVFEMERFARYLCNAVCRVCWRWCWRIRCARCQRGGK